MAVQQISTATSPPNTDLIRPIDPETALMTSIGFLQLVHTEVVTQAAGFISADDHESRTDWSR